MQNIEKTQYCLTLKLTISATKKMITCYEKQMYGKRLNIKLMDKSGQALKNNKKFWDFSKFES